MWFRRRKRVANPVLELRSRMLAARAAELGLAPRAATEAWGVLMETAYPDAVVTLVALADGTTSLYFSNGGGIIGAGAHESVVAANRSFLELATALAPTLVRVDDTPMPEAGYVVFYVRTVDGTMSGAGVEEDLGKGRHPLSPLFHAGHRVITAIREASS